MTAAKEIARARRKATAVETWRVYRRDRGGVLGLVVLVVGVVLALLAPMLTDASGLDVTRATGGTLQGPDAEFWLGTDESGRSVLLLTWWGARVSLLVGLAAAALSMIITHDLGLAWNIADRVAVMYRGEIVELGDVQRVLLDPQHDYTRTLLEAVPAIERAADG